MFTYCLKCKKNTKNKTVNKFLLAGDKLMSEMHLRQLGFTYSACGPFTKNKQNTQKFMRTGDTIYICKNELHKACFQHDMAYSKYKDLEKITQTDKALRDKAFENENSTKYDGCQRGLASMVYNFFDKKSKGAGIKNEIKENQQLPNELHKSIIKKFKKKCILLLKTIFGVLI